MQKHETDKLHGEMSAGRNNARIQRVIFVLAALLAVAAALICGSLIFRDATHMNNANERPSEIFTIAVTIVLGSLIIFIFSMKLTPLLLYRRHLKELTRGLSRTVEGEVVRFDETTTFRDGLSFYAMIVNIGDLNEPEDERLLYWDGQLPRPEVRVGDRVRATAHGNDIIGFSRE